MRKLLSAVSVCASLFLGWGIYVNLAWAQCNGVFPANTLCGNLTGSPQPPAAFSAGGTVVGPGSATVSDFAVFGNTAGTSLLDSGVKIATSGANLPLLNGSDTYSGNNTFTSLTVFTAPTSFTSTVSASTVGQANFTSVFNLSGSAGLNSQCLASAGPGQPPVWANCTVGLIFTPEQYGASGNCSVDDAIPLNSVFVAAIASAPATVHLSKCYRTTTGVSMSGPTTATSPVIVEGGGVVKCDLTVTPCFTVGTSGFLANNVTLREITIDRAAGTPGANTIGLELGHATRTVESHVLVQNHGINRLYTCIPCVGAQGDIQATAIAPMSHNAVQYHWQIANFAGLQVFDGEMGQNGGDAYNITAVINITGAANDIVFHGTEFLPRNPSGTQGIGISFTGLTNNTGVFRFIDDNLESTNLGIASDAATPVIQELSIVGGRWSTATSGLVQLNPATRPIAWRIENANTQGISIFSPQWLSIVGNTIGQLTGTSSALVITGTASPNSSALVVGNQIIGGNTAISGSFSNFVFSGNTCDQTWQFFDSATATKHVSASNAC